jgi:hypothetical protein
VATSLLRITVLASCVESEEIEAIAVSKPSNSSLDESFDGLHVSVPAHAAGSNSSLLSVALIVYNSDDYFVETSPNASRSVVSKVVSVNIAQLPAGQPLNGTVTMTFAATAPENATWDNFTCVYWNFTSSAWLSDGCHVESTLSTNTSVVCKCQHLTNFAVLADVHESTSDLSEANRYALELITYIGCGLSIAGLAFTLFTYAVFKVRS